MWHFAWSQETDIGIKSPKKSCRWPHLIAADRMFCGSRCHSGCGQLRCSKPRVDSWRCSVLTCFSASPSSCCCCHCCCCCPPWDGWWSASGWSETRFHFSSGPPPPQMTGSYSAGLVASASMSWYSLFLSYYRLRKGLYESQTAPDNRFDLAFNIAQIV